MNIIIDNNLITLKYCNNFINRFLGLMFKKNINESLCFPRCNSIHTFFMLNSIDVIMTDKDYNILYIYKRVKPYRIILPKHKVYYTFEFPSNKFNFNVNEKIKVIK